MKVMMLALVGLFVYTQSDAIGKVESSFDKKANFAALHTYSWSGGARAYNEEAHRLVIAAFEKEMTALGFKQVPSGADVTLSYYNITSTDVDLKKLDEATRAGSAIPTKMRAPNSGPRLPASTSNPISWPPPSSASPSACLRRIQERIHARRNADFSTAAGAARDPGCRLLLPATRAI